MTPEATDPTAGELLAMSTPTDGGGILTSDNDLEERVMEALRNFLLGDRAIPDQHEQWWRNLAREAIEAMRAALIIEREAGKR